MLYETIQLHMQTFKEEYCNPFLFDYWTNNLDRYLHYKLGKLIMRLESFLVHNTPIPHSFGLQQQGIIIDSNTFIEQTFIGDITPFLPNAPTQLINCMVVLDLKSNKKVIVSVKDLENGGIPKYMHGDIYKDNDEEWDKILTCKIALDFYEQYISYEQYILDRC